MKNNKTRSVSLVSKRRNAIRNSARVLFVCAAFLSTSVLASPFQYEMEHVEESHDSAGHLEWAGMLERWAEQRESQRHCYIEHQDCPPELAGLRVVLRHATGASRFGQFRLINLFVNQRRWVAEAEQEDKQGAAAGEIDHWQTVAEFFSNGGDCEDFAIAKYLLLRELGVPANDLRVVATLDSESGRGHALLAIRIDGAVFLADSDNTVYRSHKRHPYEFIYSINEQGIWVHRDDLLNIVTTSKTRREQ